MNYAELLLQYNGFLLLFSATGFLVSLFWFMVTERSKRGSLYKKKVSKQDLFDEKVFFGEFEKMENPAMGEGDEIRPIFDSIEPNSDLDGGEDLDSSDENQISQRKFIKMNDLPKFPTLKKELEDTLGKKTQEPKSTSQVLTEDEKEVQGLLEKIKSDLKKRND